MFTTVDNSHTFVKMIFTSDDDLAAQINMQAARGGHPRVASPETMGGYRYPILEDLAEGDTFCIVSSAMPGNAAQQRIYERLRNDPDTIYGYVDSSKVFFVQVDNRNGTTGRLNAAGWDVSFVPGGKTPKRVKTINRPFRWWTKIDRPLNVYVIPDDGYSSLADTEGFTEEEIESLLDGAFIINARLVDECRENIRFLVHNETADPTLSINHLRQYYYMRESAHFVSFNARLFGPMRFSGTVDNIRGDAGQLKGEAYARREFPSYLEDADVICAASALKWEVSNEEKTFILLEPQVAKLAEGEIQVFTDLQTISNLPALFDPVQMRKTTAAWIDDMLDHLKQGKLLESWYTQTNPVFQSGTFHNPSDVNTMTRWNARAWAMSGMSYTQSPWMFMHLARLMAESLRAKDNRTIRFPVPAAMRVLVITASLAGAFGCDELEVERGDIRYLPDMEALVVHDEDWIEMRPSHGGHDLDDFFSAYYRTIDGERKVILVRSPNDWGEYSIFNYVEDDYYPYWERANGTIIAFPEVSSDPALWPERLSEAIALGKVRYRGLPSERAKAERTGEPEEPHAYCRADLDWQVLNGSDSAASVGQNVNARILYSLTVAPHKGHRPYQLCSMEKAVDAGTQGGLQEDVKAVIAEAGAIVEDVKSSLYKVDYFMWASRFQPFYGPLSSLRIDSKGRLTQLHAMRTEKAHVLLMMAQNWAKVNCRPDPVIHSLGLLRYAQARELLVRCRLRMVTMQPPGEMALEPEHWRTVHEPILTAIESSPTDADRHNFVISLWSACLKTPTASRNLVTDQAVMNPHVFSYLLDALRFYGIARYVRLTDEGEIETYKVDEWDLTCTSCGKPGHTNNPLALQRFYFYGGWCVECRNATKKEATA